ncbi:MAG: MBL fold metallo-hydrolase [Caulobacteraceae bacterium]
MGYKLVPVKGSTYYLDGAVKIGIIKNEKKPTASIIIDTGIDDDSGRRIIKIMQENGMGPGVIINTHSHADHCGGNSIIKSRTGAKVYAPHFDRAIIEYPELEAFYLYSANPLSEMDTKFLKAKASKVDYILEEGELEVEGIKLGILPLHGHTPAMIGVVTPDNVLFAGDAFFSQDILGKHGLPYFTDIGKTLETLEYIKGLDYDYFIPCHGDALQDPSDVIASNIQILRDITGFIADWCVEALDREQIASRLIERFDIKLSIPQYYLTVSTVSAFLSYMTDEKILGTLFEDNRLKFVRL